MNIRKFEKFKEKEKETRRKNLSTILAVVGFSAVSGFLISYFVNAVKKGAQKYCYQPQTHNVIGDPNARNPNDTYIDTPTGRAYYTVDGKSIEDHFK